MADISKIKILDGTVYNIKDSSARTSLDSIAVASNFLVRERHYSSDTTITHGAATTINITITKSGYTPLCIVGAGVVNGETNGANYTWCTIYNAYLMNSTTSRVSARNINTGNNAVIRAFTDVLYRLN